MVSIFSCWHHRDARHLFDEEDRENEKFERNEKANLAYAFYV